MPQLKAKWLVEKEKQLNLDGNFKIDASAEAPFFTLFDAQKGNSSLLASYIYSSVSIYLLASVYLTNR